MNTTATSPGNGNGTAANGSQPDATEDQSKSASISGASSTAAFYRLIDRFRGTLAIDEADYARTELWAEIVKVINAGYKKDTPILKCDKYLEPEAFDAFGPKILTSRIPFADPATESRCLTCYMTPRSVVRQDIPLQLPKDFGQEAAELRNQLLGWRLKNYWSIKVDSSIEAKLFGLEPRQIEILSPLVAVYADENFRKELIRQFAADAENRRADSDHALLVAALEDMLPPCRDESPLWDPTTKKLRVKEVAEKASELRRAQEPTVVQEAYKFTTSGETAKQTGGLIRSLGFATRKSYGNYVFEIDMFQLRDLLKRYPDTQAAARPEPGEGEQGI
jgi:hypothetical protein